MAQESVHGWKKWLAVGFGFGAGATITVALIVGFIAWYSSRPKPWNSRDLTATFSTPLYNLDDGFNIVGMELEYVIENKTMKDYTLSPDESFFLQDGGALRRSFTGKYKIADQCFIPAKTKVKCEIAVPADFSTDNGVDGFAVFDNLSRTSIVFPKPPSPTPNDRKKTLADMQRMADKYHENPGIKYLAPPKTQP